MSLLTDDEIMEITPLDPEWRELKQFARAIESAVLTKLAEMELPEPGVHGLHAFTETQLRQAFAQGAASQLSAEPVGFVHAGELDTAMALKKGYAHLYPMQHPSTSVPLFTRKEPS